MVAAIITTLTGAVFYIAARACYEQYEERIRNFVRRIEINVEAIEVVYSFIKILLLVSAPFGTAIIILRTLGESWISLISACVGSGVVIHLIYKVAYSNIPTRWKKYRSRQNIT